MRSGLVLLVLSSFLPACSGDHDAFAARPGSSRDAGDSGSELVPDAETDADDDLDASEPPLDAGDTDLPPKPFVLTIVNGIPDAPAIRLCFVSQTDGSEVLALSFPKSPVGLAYGSRLVVESAESGKLADIDVRPYVLAGDLEPTSAIACDELVASKNENVVVRPLPLLPAGSFAGNRSALLVTTGCIGGEGHVADGELRVCGQGYSEEEPTASLVMVAMARAPKGSGIGLQAVHALANASPISVEIQPSSELAPISVTSQALPGTIAPQAPAASHEESSFGALASQATIVIRDANSRAALGSFPLGVALEKGGLAPSDFVEGRSYTLVAVGPEPQIGNGPWWSAFAVVAVAGDP